MTLTLSSGANHESYRTDPCRDLDSRPVWWRLRLPQRQQRPRRGRRPTRVNPDYPHRSVSVGQTVIESPSGEVYWFAVNWNFEQRLLAMDEWRSRNRAT